jgi:hypothetical protein
MRQFIQALVFCALGATGAYLVTLVKADPKPVPLEQRPSADVTGHFMWTTPDVIEYLELSQAGDGSLQGSWTMSSTSWADVPAFAELQARVTGRLEGDALSLHLWSPRWPQPSPMTGVLEGQALVLVTGDSVPMRFTSVTPAAYRAAIDRLKAAKQEHP